MLNNYVLKATEPLVTPPVELDPYRDEITVVTDTKKIENNYVLSWCPTSDDDINNDNDDDNDIDDNPVTPPEAVIATSSAFEVLYENLSSYPYDLDMSNKKFIVKTFTLPDNKSITITNDSTVPDKIVSKISGDTGIPVILVKTILLTDNKRKINATYTEEQY